MFIGPDLRSQKVFATLAKGKAAAPKNQELDPEETLLKYWPQICFRVKNSIGRSTPDWEDVGSEILLGVIEAIRKGSFRGESSLGTFIYTVTTHKIVDFIRQKSKGPPPAPESGPDFDPSVEVETQERVRLVAELLKRLKPRYADILYLHYYLDLSRNEIAQIYGISPGRAGVLISAARNTLGDVLRNLGLPGRNGRPGEK